MTGMLAGVRVLDFGQFFAGPYAARFLADMGADVIKLEPYPGDTMRPLTRVFMAGQRGKRAIAVDLKSPEGLAIGLELAARADIVTHNMRPGAAERMGMGYEQVRKVNPGVIYLHSPGWGASGPHSHRQSFAPLVAGLCGLHWEMAGAGNPPVAPVHNEDYANPFVGAAAILMALIHRQRTGEGQFIEAPQLNATMTMAGHIVRRADGAVLGGYGLDAQQLGVGPLERLYRTADGWVAVVARTDGEFAALCAVLGLDGAPADTRFATAAARQAHADALAEVLGRAFAERATDDTWAALDAAGVPCEIPRGINDEAFLRDDANLAIGRVDAYTHPLMGEMRELARFVRFSDDGGGPGRPAPLLGQHTAEILAELGKSAEEIRDLTERRVVRQ